MISIKPRFRIFGIRESTKVRIPHERTARPFPDVAGHIQTSVCARAFRKTPDRRCPPEVIIEITNGGRRLISTPTETPLLLSFGIPRRSLFPFGFGRQALIHKPRVSLRLVPTDAYDRVLPRYQALVEHSLHAPLSALLRPVKRGVPIFALAPFPAFIAPPFALLIPAFADEMRVLFIGRQQFVYLESRNMNGVNGALVVISESMPARSHRKIAFRNACHLARPRGKPRDESAGGDAV